MARILVIDDSEDVRGMITLVLQTYGHEITGLQGDVQVESVISYFDPQLILIDVKLGKQSGRELCQRVKKTNKNLPVILMSADEKLLEAYEDCSADDILAKPFNIRDLKVKIENALVS